MSGLSVTGDLTTETVHKMKEPRCGFPDVVPAEEETKPKLGKRRKRYNTSKREADFNTVAEKQRILPATILKLGFTNHVQNVITMFKET